MQETEHPDKAPAKGSASILILKAALTQVDDVLVNAEKTINMLQQNLTQVTSQRVGLQYQKNMLTELITKIQDAESK
jgi:hypothetical protein